MRPTCKSAASLRNPELTLDLALHDARVFFRGDLAEDGTVEGLFRRLAVGRSPELASEDGFKDFLAVHRAFGSGVLEDDDGGVEQGQPLDRLVGFVRRIDGVLVFLVFARGRKLCRFIFGKNLDGGGFYRLRFSRCLFGRLFGLLWFFKADEKIMPDSEKESGKVFWVSVVHRNDFIADGLGGSRFRQFAPSAVIHAHTHRFSSQLVPA